MNLSCDFGIAFVTVDLFICGRWIYAKVMLTTGTSFCDH